MADLGTIGSGHSYSDRLLLSTGGNLSYASGKGRSAYTSFQNIVVRSGLAVGSGHSAVSRSILPTLDFPIVEANGHSYMERIPLATSDFPVVKSNGFRYVTKISNIVVRSGLAVGSGHVAMSRAPLSMSDNVSGRQRVGPLASKNIPVWSVRPNPTPFTTDPTQVYLSVNPGTISGTLKTAASIDAYYTVRLYYRPTGYMIDQVRTNADGTFVFNKNIDKNEIGNYYIVAFDLTSTYNAIVYDLITPG